jgi:hypothetical protein
VNERYCPYHDLDHLTDGWECPVPPDGLAAYVGWSGAGKARAAARMAGADGEPRGLPDPLVHGVGIDDRGDD